MEKFHGVCDCITKKGRIWSMFQKRLGQVKKSIGEQKLDGVLLSAHSTIAYLSGYSNFSKDEREAYIFIGKNFEYIVTDGRYSEAIKNEVPHLTLFQRGRRKTIEGLLKKHKKGIKSLGIEEDNLTVSEHKILRKYFKKIKHFNVKSQRSIKTPEEIKKIEKACKLGDKTFEHILGKIKEGISEKELAFEIEYFIKKNGVEISFPPIVAFGKNSSVPHHKTSDKRLTINDKLILLDFGVKHEDYCSDMTRTVFFGTPDKKQKDIYETVLEAQKRAIDFINYSIKMGKKILAKDVDSVSRKYIISEGFKSIPHSLGHGIGLEVHESPHLSPKSKDILKEGMVFSIEPGIYIPGFGSPRFAGRLWRTSSKTGEAGGVRIEDLFLLGKDGLKQITNSPKKLIII